MKIKTSELVGVALNWAVARLQNPFLYDSHIINALIRGNSDFEYSTSWAEGGPIIHREKLELRPGLCPSELWTCWGQTQHGARLTQQGKTGPTPLVAAMRCYVASELGDEINLPEELA